MSRRRVQWMLFPLWLVAVVVRLLWVAALLGLLAGAIDLLVSRRVLRPTPPTLRERVGAAERSDTQARALRLSA